MIGKMKGGGAIIDFLNAHQYELSILYIIGLVLLVIYLYYVFYYLKHVPKNDAVAQETPAPTKNNRSILTKIKEKADKLDDLKVIKSLKGTLDTWGDDIDKMPEQIRANAISCYQNPKGCIF
jgi:hypothetical protein